MYIGWFLCHYSSPGGRGCVRSCCFSQAGEVCEHWCLVFLWASSALQLVTSWTTLVGGRLSTLVRLDRPASCISSSRSWYSVVTRCCFIMVFPLSPRTDVALFCLVCLIDRLPRDYIYRGSNIIYLLTTLWRHVIWAKEKHQCRQPQQPDIRHLLRHALHLYTSVSWKIHGQRA